MKLLTKNTLLLFIVTLFVFVIGGIVFYTHLKDIIYEEASEALYLKKEEVEKFVLKNKRLPTVDLSEHAIKLLKSEEVVKENLKSINLYVKEADEILPFLQLSFNLKIVNENFVCTISHSLIESDDLIETIRNSFVLIISILIILFVVINYFFSKKMWAPFFKTLNKINIYDVEQHQTIQLDKTNTKEFELLNDAIKKMTIKISENFNNLKSFTENASHELQTPLAIIKNKLEVMLQSEGLNEDLTKQIIEINQSVSRLSKLNQTLLLLSKIENNQFKSNESIDFSEIIENKLLQFEDLIEIKKIILKKSIQKSFVNIHPILADIIVSNLLLNAIRYSKENGEINIKLNQDAIEISNSGSPLQNNGKEIFNRFYKENPSSDSTGLGLALVKQIATVNNHTINYEFINNMHIFKYRFNYRKSSE